jgi:hypothetical protein
MAVAGRSLEMRQLPNDPASSPPASASSTATRRTAALTDAAIGTETVLLVVGFSTPFGVTMRWPVGEVRVAVSLGAMALMIAAPASPRPTPTAAPSRPTTADSPMTWATIRRPRQPSALSVPNSDTRRDTAAIVSSTATAKAATSTRTDSHLPRSSASFAVDVSDPVTSLARLLGDVTSASGRALATGACSAGMSAALAAVT